MRFLIVMSFLICHNTWSEDIAVKSVKENLTKEQSINELFSKLFSFQEKNKQFRTFGVLDKNFIKAKEFFSSLEEKNRLHYSTILLDMVANNVSSVMDEIYQVLSLADHGSIQTLSPYEMKLASTKNVLVILKSNGVQIPEHIISMIKDLKNLIEKTKTKINAKTK